MSLPARLRELTAEGRRKHDLCASGRAEAPYRDVVQAVDLAKRRGL
jgi:hypothetical protein